MAEVVGGLIIAGLSSAGVSSIGIAGLGVGGSIAGITVAGVSLTTIVGAGALALASIGLNYALRPELPKPENGSQPLKQAIPSRVKGYGRNRLSGYYMLFEEYQENSYDVMAFHSGRIAGVVSMHLHDDLVVHGTGYGGDHDVYAADISDGRYEDLGAVRVRYSLGEVPVGAPLFFDDGGPPVWDPATHRGSGIAWASLFCQGEDFNPADFTKVYPSGLPLLSLVADCSPVWDPRDIEQQARLDPSSWRISYNPIIQLIDYLTAVDGGMGLDFETIFPADRLAQWMAEADLCDELVAKADGSFEPRYRSSGWFQFDNKPEDVINGLLATCDGWMSEAGDGTFSITVGVYREPTVTITDVRDFSLNYGRADEEQVNQLDINYTEPEQKYVPVQIESLRDEEAIAASGIVRPQTLDLKWVQSKSQAARLSERAMLRLNPLLSGSFKTNLSGLQAVGHRWIKLQYPFVSGLQDCVIEVQGSEIDLMAGEVSFTFVRVAPDKIEAYNPETDEPSGVPIPPPINVDTLLLQEDGTPLQEEDGGNFFEETA